MLIRWKRAFYAVNELFGAYKWNILFLSILGFISGLFESIGIGTLVPILSILLSGSASANDAITVNLVKSFKYLNIPITLPILFSFTFILFVLKSIFSVFYTYMSVKISTDFEKNTRSELYKRTLTSKWPFLLKQKIGYLENVLMHDIDLCKKAMYGFTTLVLDLASLVAYAFIAFHISRFITFVTLLFSMLLFLGIYPLNKIVRRNMKRQNVLGKRITHFINENIIGMKVIKAFGKEDQVSTTGNIFFEETRDLALRQAFLRGVASSILSPLSMLLLMGVFAFSYQRPNFSIAIFAATMYLIQRMFIHINTAQKSVNMLNDSYTYLMSVVDLKRKIFLNQEESSGNKKYKFDKELKFEDVGFSYNSNKTLLSNITFEIKKGEMVGLIGESGSGKTTLTDLLLRLFIPTGGSIKIDGIDIKEINLESWRNNMGYVSQDIFLLNDTISNNIKFYDDSISDEDIVEAAKSANIYDFIIALENGFETIIGERGVLLSGGQKQRISLARALAKKPLILILDEATSALDKESEYLVQEAIEKLNDEVTVIAIAHRLSTINRADRLIVIENGRIKEVGTPISLLKDKDSYLYRMNEIE